MAELLCDSGQLHAGYSVSRSEGGCEMVSVLGDYPPPGFRRWSGVLTAAPCPAITITTADLDSHYDGAVVEAGRNVVFQHAGPLKGIAHDPLSAGGRGRGRGGVGSGCLRCVRVPLLLPLGLASDGRCLWLWSSGRGPLHQGGWAPPLTPCLFAPPGRLPACLQPRWAAR